MLANESRFIERFKTHVEKTFDFRTPPRAGDDVVRMESLKKAFGTRVVHDGLTITVRRKERWAVMGENGAGKSTLLKMIAGALAPDAGEAAIGASVTMGYYAQHVMEALSGDRTVLEEL